MDDRPRFDPRTVAALALVIGATAYLLKDAPPVEASSAPPQVKSAVEPGAAIRAYELARSGAQPLELCARAGAVAAAYRGRKDRQTADIWQEIEDVHCTEAHFWEDRSKTGAPSESASAGVPGDPRNP